MIIRAIQLFIAADANYYCNGDDDDDDVDDDKW